MKRNVLLAILISLVLVPAAAHAGKSNEPGPAASPATPRQFTSSSALPGVGGAEISIVATAADEGRAMSAISSVLGQAASSAGSMTSEARTVNEQPRKTPVTVGAKLAAVLERCKTFSALTQGAFDITGSSGGGLGFIKKDWRSMKINTGNNTVTIKGDDTEIDLTTFGLALRGFIADDISKSLSSQGWSNVQVRIGNVTRNTGRDIHTQWTISLDTPTAAEQGKFAYRATNYSVSNVATAMINPRLFPQGIVDPRSRELVTSPAVVNTLIFASDAATASAYAIATYANSASSAQAGLNFIEQHPEIKGIVVALDGKVLSSRGLGVSKSNYTETPAAATASAK